jgi:hypothetical protein
MASFAAASVTLLAGAEGRWSKLSPSMMLPTGISGKKPACTVLWGDGAIDPVSSTPDSGDK